MRARGWVEALCVVTIGWGFGVWPVTTVSASPGDLDRSFGSGGIVTTSFAPSDAAGAALAIQADGKIVVAGTAFRPRHTAFAVARYTTSGALDPTFGSDGEVVTDFGPKDDAAHAVAIQADGKIVVAGITDNGLAHDFALARYTTAGALDPTFDGDGLVITDMGSKYDDGRSLAIQGGRIIVAGRVGHRAEIGLARYDTSGQLDPSFDGDGKVVADFSSSSEANAVAVQADGRIVVAGDGVPTGQSAAFMLVRYTATGAQDDTFGTGGVVTTSIGSSSASAKAVAIRSDGGLVAGGLAFDGTHTVFALARYTTGGALDATFGGDGTVTTSVLGSVDTAAGVAIQNDGRIVAVGSSYNGTDEDVALVRYRQDGTLDPRFGGDGTVTTAIGSSNDQGAAVALQDDGRIVVAGSTTTGLGEGDVAVLRYRAGRTSSGPLRG